MGSNGKARVSNGVAVVGCLSATVAPEHEAGDDVRAADGSRGPLATGDPALPVEPGVDEAIEVAPPETAHEEVLVLDFGGQYSQLIARRIRECGVYAELLPHDLELETIRERAPAALVLSGGPASVYSEGAPRLRRELLELGIPVLGICYGMQAMVLELGGRVEGAEAGEFGRTALTLAGDGGRLLAGPAARAAVLDEPPRLGLRAARRASTALAASPGSPVAALEDTERGLYGIQFHPEVVHTPVRPADPRALPARDRRLRRRLVAGLGDRRAGRADPRPGRRRRRDLRALRRRRLGDRRGARPPRDRRPAHLRARRPRPDAQERGRSGGRGDGGARAST